jgi:hypothetical protein
MNAAKLLPISALALASCASPDFTESQIVFGIDQSLDPATGAVVTTGGYELLELGSHGWRTRGYVDREKSCWLERLGLRRGPVRVDHGIATFRGGLLPPEGLAIVGTPEGGEDVVHRGPAWATGDRLTFDARGFAAPRIEPFVMIAPRTELAVAEPPDGELALSGAEDLRVAWTPEGLAHGHESVVVSLRAGDEARGLVELRCFFDEDAGAGLVPGSFLAELAAEAGSGATGKLGIATHRQVTVHARGGWTIYVVATAGRRVQPFTLAHESVAAR